ncbi:MOSC N-terminal beta barrel domain-containing protein [Xylariaceae sp. FL1019]|nr:MOSC N-terminal beta barrel domain-containing protein [Xylariaceae sp. FL1019]
MEDSLIVYDARIDALRQHEFPMLKDNIYLDHAGTTLYSKSLVDSFALEMTANLFGNPHSASACSQASMSRIEDARLCALRFFGADPADFDLVFVANATAGIKLVAEAFRGFPQGFEYRYHEASHTSLVGVREEAAHSTYMSSEGVEDWINRSDPATGATVAPTTEPVPTLFAYPAQSNMDGKRFPISWCQKLQKLKNSTGSQTYTLLDAASLAGTSPLNLRDAESAPDFIVLSFYKILGFPDLGGLLVKRQAASVFQQRRYFGGGTVDMVVCSKEQWHAPKTQSLHDALEDGTLPIHSIFALKLAFDVHRRLYGSMEDIASHTADLTRRLYQGLENFHHGNGEAVCTMYSEPPWLSTYGNGPIVAFNLRNAHGAWVSLAEFEKLASLKNFHLRTGGVCNPGGIAAALGLETWEMRQNFSAGFRCGDGGDIINGKPTGIIRVSLGAMSTRADVDTFLAFIKEFYEELGSPKAVFNQKPCTVDSASGFFVQSVMVYPIKSCGGFRVPDKMAWGVKPEGLAWDREWCLVHQGTGQALSQKRHPQMALIQPEIDLSSGRLRIRYRGPQPLRSGNEVSVPLSDDPGVFRFKSSARSMASRVCGEEVSIKTYISEEIKSFFTAVLGIPCVLARFPPGGTGKNMRYSKAHLQSHQKNHTSKTSTPLRPPGIHTPPDSDSESERQRILLSNESPILAINLSSLYVLNLEIAKKGGTPVPPEAFRANIVIASSSMNPEAFAYSEDDWSRLRIAGHDFRMLGACRRCHMICINQETASKSQEPFVTLAKTRRFDGKVFFGTHMCHMPPQGADTRETQFPTIRIGDKVEVDPQRRESGHLPYP